MVNVSKIGYPDYGQARFFNLNGKEYTYVKNNLKIENFDLSKMEDFRNKNKIVETKLITPNEIYTRIEIKDLNNKNIMSQIKTLLKIDGEYSALRVDKSGAFQGFKTNIEQEVKDASLEKANSSEMIFVKNLNKDEVLKLVQKAKRLLKRM